MEHHKIKETSPKKAMRWDTTEKNSEKHSHGVIVEDAIEQFPLVSVWVGLEEAW